MRKIKLEDFGGNGNDDENILSKQNNLKNF